MFSISARCYKTLLLLFALTFKSAHRIISNSISIEKGPLAQLGERFAGSEEVVGSIPIGSTIIN